MIKLPLFILLLPFAGLSQTISSSPIYQGPYSMTILEMENGGIYFGYQNPDYTAIVDIVGFSVSNKAEAIFLIEEGLRVLGMDRTAKDQHIYHDASGVELTRYGFSQKTIHIQRYRATKAILNKMLQAIQEYSYQHPANQQE